MASSIKINADASQFKTEVSGAAQSIKQMAASAQQAKDQILASFKMQRQAAIDVGATQDELESIYKRSAQMMANVTDQNAGRIISSLTRISERNKQVAAELAALNKIAPTPQVTEHYEPTAQQKASAAIRSTGGTLSIRAAESFATSVPILSKAFDAAFPVVGAIALTTEVVRGIDAFIEMRKQAIELQNVLRDGFESVSAPIQLTSDNLRKANDELEISIARLEHRPTNTLALALDEARINADDLSASAQKAFIDVKKLLAENQVGLYAQLFMGKGDTGSVSSDVTKRFQALSNLQREQRDAVRSGQDTSDIDGRITAARNDFRSYLDSQRKERSGTAVVADFSNGRANATKTASYSDAHGDQGANLSIIAGAQDILDSQDDLTAQQKRNVSDTQRQKQLQDNQKRAQASQQAASKALSDLKQSWEDQFAAFNSTGDKSIEDERKFWFDRINAVDQGSKAYEFAERKADDLLKQLNVQRRKTADDLRKANDESQKDQLKQLQQALNPGAIAQSKGIQDAQTSGIALRDAHRNAVYSVADANIQYAEQTGRISANDSAIQRQTLHTIQYTAAIADLKTALAAVQVGPDADAQRNKINTSITDLDARRSVQVIQDGAAVAATSWRDALKNANSEWVQDSQNSAKQVVQLYSSAISGLNQNLSSLMVGGHADFAGYFRGLGQQIATIGLQKIESPILGAFGLNKADGSSSSPFHVIVDNGGGAGGVAGGIGGLLSSGSSDSSDSNGSGGFLSKAGGFVASLFGGGRAVGGGVDSGTTYLVGERGPELFTPGANGTITPNNKLGGDTHNWSIDARGSNDPAATEAAVRRGITAATPHIIAASRQSDIQDRRRSPQGRRS